LLGNHPYCYLLTVTDHASRYLLTCEALSSLKEDYAFTVVERLFKECGLPAQVRSDNGVPIASAHSLFNLSKVQLEQTRRLVVAAGHWHRMHQAWPCVTKRSPRTHLTGG
jgi:transposase InsO family protein